MRARLSSESAALGIFERHASLQQTIDNKAPRQFASLSERLDVVAPLLSF
jgi:hypothetical protein